MGVQSLWSELATLELSNSFPGEIFVCLEMSKGMLKMAKMSKNL